MGGRAPAAGEHRGVPSGRSAGLTTTAGWPGARLLVPLFFTSLSCLGRWGGGSNRGLALKGCHEDSVSKSMLRVWKNTWSKSKRAEGGAFCH